MKKKLLAMVLGMVMVCTLSMSTAALDMAQSGQKNTISAGAFHTAAIDPNGSLWTWGYNGSGQLGNGTTENSTVPVKVLDDVVFVSCGSHTTAAIKVDGSLWMWGQNSHGELGNGGRGNAEKTERGNFWGSDLGPMQTVPTKVMDNVAFVSCAGHVENFTAAIKTDGSLWMWGENNCGQLGNGSMENSNAPVKVMDNVAAVSCGATHVAAIKTDGSLWTWGYNGCGELGNGGVGNATYSLNNSETPAQVVPNKVMDDVVAVSCGNESTAAVKTDGTLWMWGVAAHGALGNGKNPEWGDDDFMQKIPVKVMDDVRAVSCFGGDDDLATAAIKTDGSLWMWGGNWYGMLGVGQSADSLEWIGTPIKVMDTVASVSGGMAHGIARKEDGGFYTWGDNEFGQLGNSGIGNSESFGDVIQTIPFPITLNIVYPSTQSVLLDGKKVEFAMYALNGGAVNYIRVRDLAAILNGSPAQFNVGWNGSVTLTGKAAYDGPTDTAPFTTEMAYTEYTAPTYVDGKAVNLEAIQIEYGGGGYTYYKLRDLAQALDFNVGWSADKGVYVETDKPYDPNN